MMDLMQPATSQSNPPAAPQRVSNAGFIDAKHEGHRQWTLVGQNDQQITQTAAELLEVSELRITRELMIANLKAVFNRVRDWCSENASQVQEARLTGKPGKLSLFFVSPGDRYDVDLDAKMTELEVQLGGSAGVGSIESFQIPPRSTPQFVSQNTLVLWQRASEVDSALEMTSDE